MTAPAAAPSPAVEFTADAAGRTFLADLALLPAVTLVADRERWCTGEADRLREWLAAEIAAVQAMEPEMRRQERRTASGWRARPRGFARLATQRMLVCVAEQYARRYSALFDLRYATKPDDRGWDFRWTSWAEDYALSYAPDTLWKRPGAGEGEMLSAQYAAERELLEAAR